MTDIDTQLALYVDPARRFAVYSNATGIFVRANDRTGHFINIDIAQLDRASLLRWLRSRGGDNPWAENVIGQMLGYGPLHE